MGIGCSKLLVVANATATFQRTNHMPSLRSCEEHDAYIAFLEKHKDEILRVRERKKDQVEQMVDDHLKSERAFTLSQMDNLIKIVGYCIGDARRISLLNKIEECVTRYPRKRTPKTYLQFVDWMRKRKVVLRRIYGARNEIEKRKVLQKGKLNEGNREVEG